MTSSYLHVWVRHGTTNLFKFIITVPTYMLPICTYLYATFMYLPLWYLCVPTYMGAVMHFTHQLEDRKKVNSCKQSFAVCFAAFLFFSPLAFSFLRNSRYCLNCACNYSYLERVQLIKKEMFFVLIGPSLPRLATICFSFLWNGIRTFEFDFLLSVQYRRPTFKNLCKKEFEYSKYGKKLTRNYVITTSSILRCLA